MLMLEREQFRRLVAVNAALSSKAVGRRGFADAQGHLVVLEGRLFSPGDPTQALRGIWNLLIPKVPREDVAQLDDGPLCVGRRWQANEELLWTSQECDALAVCAFLRDVVVLRGRCESAHILISRALTQVVSVTH